MLKLSKHFQFFSKFSLKINLFVKFFKWSWKIKKFSVLIAFLSVHLLCPLQLILNASKIKLRANGVFLPWFVEKRFSCTASSIYCWDNDLFIKFRYVIIDWIFSLSLDIALSLKPSLYHQEALNFENSTLQSCLSY